MHLDNFIKLLNKHKLDGYFLPRGNLFIGQEDILPEENLLSELTGFSGSAGNLLILTRGKSVLFVDGRYELQASHEVDLSQVGIICTTTQHITPLEWMKNHLPQKFKLGFDPWLISLRNFQKWEQQLPQCRISSLPLQDLGINPQAPCSDIFAHAGEYCGISRDEKISSVLTFLQEQNLDAYLFTAADSSSWLLNLRAHSLPYTPLLRGYTLVDKDGRVSLFAYRHHLTDNPALAGLNCYDISELPRCLSAYKRQTLGVDFASCPEQISALADKYKITLRHAADTAAEQKCIKNPVELQGINAAHQRDAAAMITFLHWLELNSATLPLTELDIAAKIRELRAEQDLFYSESFDTIVASGAHGAIIHYHPTAQSNAPLEKNSLLLIDSGAQYQDGTTDITRTLAIGTPTPEMINNYTLVLKGHIDLFDTIFPQGTGGRLLDSICRRPLWQQGLDYNHGTGHGVGCFLDVHEGPIGIATSYSLYPLSQGMITSIEPGYYLTDRYGIRIENLAEIIPAEYEGFLAFKSLTLVPYDRRLINKSLLSAAELDWLNRYHKRVWQTISPLLDNGAHTWLEQACAPL